MYKTCKEGKASDSNIKIGIVVQIISSISCSRNIKFKVLFKTILDMIKVIKITIKIIIIIACS
jgi:hypothetical protein